MVANYDVVAASLLMLKRDYSDFDKDGLGILDMSFHILVLQVNLISLTCGPVFYDMSQKHFFTFCI
jgi:hypothetical protein